MKRLLLLVCAITCLFSNSWTEGNPEGWDAISDSIDVVKSRYEAVQKESQFFQSLVDEQRDNLTADLETMLHLFPVSPYNGGIWLRLAELVYETETHEFEVKIERYDDSLDAARGKVDSSGEALDSLTELADINSPKITYTRTIYAYDQVLQHSEYSSYHDAALYYKAICLIRMNREDEAVDLYKTLVATHPTSKHYHAALLKIGDYYYNRPFIDNGQGYHLAADYYRKAISGPKHPLYGEAMYKLGWCYFQQDRFAEAVSIFRNLVETADLNFSGSSAKQMILNPLLRDEAIEFLAISLDESGGLEEALSFLQVIGNDNYSARVLLQLASVYTGRSDYPQAIRALQLLLDQYPLALNAPEAQLKLAEAHLAAGQKDESDEELLSFFDLFSRGSDWYRNNDDERMRAFVDSQAVKILVQSSENILRRAQSDEDRGLYITVAKNYSRLLEQYPGSSSAYDVEWNLAVILDKHIRNHSAAFYHYMRVGTAYPQETNRSKALLAALASAQTEWESGTAKLDASDSTLAGLGLDTALSRAEANMVLAAETYWRYFPRGEKLADVLMLEAAVYYNRGRYAQAIPLYEHIASIQPRPKSFQEVYKLAAGSYMALSNYPKAEEWYQKLFGEALDTLYIELGRKSRVEAAFRGAQSLLEKEGPAATALALQEVAKKYHGAPLSEVALFTAAEILEKGNLFSEAASAYTMVVSEYPQSKLADGALFNASANLENAAKYQEAIDIYEKLLNTYPDSPHRKNALFNIALDYEKLGKFEKVAEANERYAQAFPGEKDAPDMLYNTGRFYYKAKEYQKSITVFQRFYTKYMGDNRELEARWYTGRAFADLGEDFSAEREFQSVLSRTADLQSSTPDISTFYAMEAQMGLAKIAATNYKAISLAGTSTGMDAAKKEKTSRLGLAVGEYEKVMAYAGPQAVAASTLIGGLYIDFASAWVSQTLGSDETGTKKIAAQKRNAAAASKSLEKGLSYLEQSLALREKLQGLPNAQEWLPWLDTAKTLYGTALWQKATLELEAGKVVVQSEIPAQVQKDPLSKYLYISKLLETSKGDFARAVSSLEKLYDSRNEYVDVAKQADLIKMYAEENYLLGGRYMQLTEDILATSQGKFDGIDPDKKEDLVFQLEDLAFEVQDQAIPLLKESWNRAERAGFIDPWSRNLLVLLQRLDAKNYPQPSSTRRVVIESGPQWWAMADSFPGWSMVRSDSVTRNTFGPVKKADFNKPPKLPGKVPESMWDPNGSSKLYFRRVMDLAGMSTRAVLTLAHSGSVNLYINGKQILHADSGSDSIPVVHTMDVAASLMPGLNLIALEANSGMAGKAALLQIEIILGEGSAESISKASSTGSTSAVSTVASTSSQPASSQSLDHLRSQYSNRQDFLRDLFKFQRKERELRDAAEAEEKVIYELREKLRKAEAPVESGDANTKEPEEEPAE